MAKASVPSTTGRGGPPPSVGTLGRLPNPWCEAFRHRFHCIDLLSLELPGRNICPLSSHPAAQPRPGRRRRGGSMKASAGHPAAQPRPGRRRRGGSMTASARHPAAQPRPGRRRRGVKTDDDTERQLVHTLAHAIVFIVSICCL